MIHEGYTYDCRICDYKATRQTHLRKHTKIKHEKHIERRFPCEFCNFVTIYKHSLKYHVSRYHSDSKTSSVKESTVGKSEIAKHIGEQVSEVADEYNDERSEEDDPKSPALEEKSATGLYICPVLACTFTCTESKVEVTENHLRLIHGLTSVKKQKFLKLS